METKDIMYLLIACFIVGIILYFAYKALYEHNLNIWIIILIYVVIALILSTSMFGKNHESRLSCLVDNDNMSLIMSDADDSLRSQLSSWVLQQNDMVLSKQNLHDNFELLIGNSNDANFMYYVTYQLHGIDASDKIKMEVMNHDDNWIIQMREFEGDFLQSGNKLYYYLFGEYEDIKTDCVRNYRIRITVEGKPELTAEMQIRLMMGSKITYQP